MRIRFDRSKRIVTSDELRPEIDSALMLLGEAMTELQERHLHQCDRHQELKVILAGLSPLQKRIRMLGIGVVRALELMAEHDPDGYQSIAENTVTGFLDYIETHGLAVPDVEELTPEEAAMLSPCKGRPH